MKVFQVPFCFYPDPVGGTEIYVESLARCLRPKGIESVVVAPGGTDQSYSHHGLSVRRFAISDHHQDLRQLYGLGDPRAADSFAKILQEEKPELVHLHAFTSAVSFRLVEEVQKRKIPILFTYHTPAISCARGNLFRWGREVCDGVLRQTLCTQCTLQGHGVVRPMADLLGWVPLRVGRAVASTKWSGKVWTALQMRELIRLQHQTLRRFLTQVNGIVAVCEWVRDLLLANGVAADKIFFSRQGVAFPSKVSFGKTEESQSDLRIVFFGRAGTSKGLHLLVDACLGVPDQKLRLDVYGVTQSVREQLYLERLKKRSQGDPRIVFQPPIPSNEIVERLRQYHLLAVPSLGLETGPLVILEAYAAGVPVLGSRLGGIAELVRDEVDGLLVKEPSVRAWTEALRRLCEDPTLISRWKTAIRVPRIMETVAEEMAALYQRIL